MSIPTIVGLIMAWACLVAAIMMDSGWALHALTAFFALSPAILVFGGTFGAVFIGMSTEEIKAIPSFFGMAFRQRKTDLNEIIATLCEMAVRSRRDGILALEDDIEKITDPFMKKGFQMCVDGVDTEKLSDVMETEFATIKQWYKGGEEFFKQLGGFSPTLGIIGTVLGLIHMLANLENAESMGPAIAMAFIATMYGVSAANLVYLPLSNKIKSASARELLLKRIVIQALLGIQGGVSPRFLEQSLQCFVHEHERKVTKPVAKE